MRRTNYSGQVGEPTVLLFGPAELNDEVLPLYVTERAKPRPKCLDPAPPTGRGSGAEESNPSDMPRLLRPRSERCGEQAASQCAEECPPVHLLDHLIRALQE